MNCVFCQNYKVSKGIAGKSISIKRTIGILNVIVDIYLPDFKYMDNNIAKKYSSAPNYSVFAMEAIEEMVNQIGNPVFDKRGMMKRGIIVRHLLLPGNLEDSKRILKYLYERYGNKIYISIMNQYTPMPDLENYPNLNRGVTEDEYEELIDYAIELGVEIVFIQEGETASESFIPDFKGEGV